MHLNCLGRLIDLSTPRVMGILNLTPDSFYDGGRYTDESAVLRQVEKMLQEGADFIDLGAYSTRPKAAFVDEEEEAKRLLPVIALLLKNFPDILLSVDTFRHRIAQNAMETGVAMVNDISGGRFDQQMFETVAKLKVPYIAMHLQGTPQTMHEAYDYTQIDIDIVEGFSSTIQKLKSLGANDIIIDPGFGFSKNISQNFELLNRLDQFKILDAPILVGISRKSMIWKTLQTTPEAALNGTTALHSIALLKGAHILRVHDVKEAKECIALVGAMNGKSF
ncbi:MAG: dihydropteroate synthase [Flavobacteriaceae bacterium]|nr:dihydropteroate synthase [Flavobacteriaceae bacterium]